MRVKRVLSIVLMVILSLGLLAGTLWVLDFLAVFNVYKTAQQIPVAGKLLPPRAKDNLSKPLVEKSPLEEEIDKLKKENQTLQNQINTLQKDTGELQKKLEIANQEKKIITDTKNALQATFDNLQSQIKEQQKTPTINYDSLGNYYGEMKPDAAVKIMDNLTDDVVIGILRKLENDQVAKILSAMDSDRAAKLTDKMKQ